MTRSSASLLLCCVCSIALTAERPNVLFLFADDLTYEALGCTQLTDIETPNLDRLAQRGVRFTRTYNMGSWSGAVCVASRTMLMTGRTVWRANAIYKNSEQERLAGRFWPERMRQAGYRTYFTGKWHVEANAEKAFDVVRHVRGGMPKITPSAYNRPQSVDQDSWDPTDTKLDGFWEGGKHWSEVAADDAVEFVDKAKSRSEPFFMYVAFNAPHDPRQAPREFLDRYPLSRIKVPQDHLPTYPYAEQIGCGPSLRDEKLGPFPRTEFAVQTHRREYYALITHLDAQIGRILDALEASGKAKNTMVFFTADHGLSIGHHGLFGKQNQYDVSVRVPFLMAGPGITPGTVCNEPIYLQDGMATSLALAGARTDDFVEFQNLMPLANGKATSNLSAGVYGAYLELQRAITLDGFKLIVYPKAGIRRLYDLQKDPYEMHDLAGEAAHSEMQQRLLVRLHELQTRFDDPLLAAASSSKNE